VAGTAHAAEQQTQQAQPVLPAATIVATETGITTARISSAGTSLLTLADGSTQFNDHVAGLQMVFPAGWLLVRVGEAEYYAAWEKQESANPAFQEIFTSMQDLDPKKFRLHALDLRPEHMTNGDIPRVVAVFAEGDTRTLEELKQGETENQLPLRGYKWLSSNSFETSQALQAVSIESQWETNAEKPGYRRRVIFKVPGGTMALDLLIYLDQKELMMPEFDQLINNMVLFTP
jgi:hypothetical protein